MKYKKIVAMLLAGTLGTALPCSLVSADDAQATVAMESVSVTSKKICVDDTDMKGKTLGIYAAREISNGQSSYLEDEQICTVELDQEGTALLPEGLQKEDIYAALLLEDGSRGPRVDIKYVDGVTDDVVAGQPVSEEIGQAVKAQFSASDTVAQAVPSEEQVIPDSASDAEQSTEILVGAEDGSEIPDSASDAEPGSEDGQGKDEPAPEENRVAHVHVEASMMTGFENGTFTFEGHPLNNAQVGIYAAGNISTVSESGDIDTVYSAGDLIETLTTDEEGNASTTTALYGGDVYAQMVSVPDGVVMDTEAHPVTFEGEEGSVSITGQQEKRITVTVKGDASMEGMTMKLVAASTISNAEGTVVAEAGTELMSGKMTGGEIVFSGLPTTQYGNPPMYYVAPESQSTSTGWIKEPSQSVTGDQDAEVVFTTEANQVTVTVTDNENAGMFLEGVELTLTSTDGTEYTARTDENGHASFSALPTGVYTLTDTAAAPGYMKSGKSVSLTLTPDTTQATASLVEIAIKASIRTLDAADGSPVSGGTYRVTKDGELFKEMTAETDGLSIKGLPQGTYTVEQESTPEGYVKADTLTFTVDGSESSLTYQMTNKRTMGYIVVHALTSTNRDPVQGATFVIYDNNGNAVSSFQTDASGNATSDKFPIGTYSGGRYTGRITYTLKQTGAPTGYTGYAKDIPVEFQYLDDSGLEVYREISVPQTVRSGETQRTVTITRQTTGTTTTPTGTTVKKGTTSGSTTSNGTTTTKTGTTSSGTKTATGTTVKATGAKTGDAQNPLMVIMEGLGALMALFFLGHKKEGDVNEG